MLFFSVIVQIRSYCDLGYLLLTERFNISIISHTSYTNIQGGFELKEKIKDDKYMGSVKVGPKGQIVIPKEIRDMFNISPGDTLVILADAEKGIALERFDRFNQIADAIFSGKAKQLYPEHTEEDSISFAKTIKAMKENIDNE